MSTLHETISRLPPKSQQAISALLGNLPADTAQTIGILRLAKGETLLQMQQPADRVYLLLEGRVQAMTQQTSGAVYAFAEFLPPTLFGEFEAFADCPFYRGTLTCLTRCVFGVMSVEEYLDWMRKDPETLFLRTRHITRQLVEQAAAERSFLFFNGVERVIVYLCGACKQTATDDVFYIRATRQQIADETGYSVKTVQRALKSLHTQRLLTFAGRAICITPAQYRRLMQLGRQRMNG